MIDDDAVDHESWIAELLSDILLEKEDSAFLHGDFTYHHRITTSLWIRLYIVCLHRI